MEIRLHWAASVVEMSPPSKAEESVGANCVGGAGRDYSNCLVTCCKPNARLARLARHFLPRHGETGEQRGLFFDFHAEMNHSSLQWLEEFDHNLFLILVAAKLISSTDIQREAFRHG